MTRLSVTASGLVTPLGFDSPSSCAAMRAGMSAIGKSTLIEPESGESLPAGRVALPQWSQGLEKLADLVAPAIRECLIAAESEPWERIPILLGVASTDQPFRLPGLDDELLNEVEVRLGLPHHSESGILPFGQVAGARGLVAAERLLDSGKSTMCIVAGVDSLIRQAVVDAYYEEGRIMTESNSNGFFPGEAGAAVLVESQTRNGVNPLHVLGIGFARESATIMSDDPCRAEGLTTAIREGLSEAGMSMADTAYRITDLTGEHYKFKEAAFAAARLDTNTREGIFDIWHPIEFIGEIGAAIFPCILAVALDAGLHGYAPGDTVLCHAGSDDGERVAVIARCRRREA